MNESTYNNVDLTDIPLTVSGISTSGDRTIISVDSFPLNSNNAFECLLTGTTDSADTYVRYSNGYVANHSCSFLTSEINTIYNTNTAFYLWIDDYFDRHVTKTPNYNFSDFNYNVAPSVGAVTVTPSPGHINSPVTASATFSDSASDMHTAVWDWGDGSTSSGTVNETNGSGSVSDNHTYTNFGTYTVTLTVTDNHNASGSAATSEAIVLQITALAPAQVYISKNLLNIGLKLDLLAEVYKDDSLVSSGQINSVNLGLLGTTLESIPFTSFSPVDFPTGSALNVVVYARNACSG